MKKIEVNNQDLGLVATIDTYEMFNGENATEDLIDWFNEQHNTNYNYDDFEWDYDHAQIVREFAQIRAKFLEDEADIIKKIRVIKTGSPREYNFSTDYAIYEITYDDEVVDKYVKDNQQDYDKWYRESGWYENTEWRDDDDINKNENIVISKLDYYLNKTIDKDDAFDALFECETEVYENNIKMNVAKK